MENIYLIIWTGGYWEGNAYIGDANDYVMWSPEFNDEDLVRMVNRITIKGDPKNCDFELRCLVPNKGDSMIRFLITSEMEWKYLLSISHDDEDLVVCVSIRQWQRTQAITPPTFNPIPTYPTQPFQPTLPFLSPSYPSHALFPPPYPIQPFNAHFYATNHKSFVQLLNEQSHHVPLVAQLVSSGINQSAPIVEQRMEFEMDTRVPQGARKRKKILSAKERCCGHSQQVWRKYKQPRHNQVTCKTSIGGLSTSAIEEVGESIVRPHKTFEIRRSNTCGELGYTKKAYSASKINVLHDEDRFSSTRI